MSPLLDLASAYRLRHIMTPWEDVVTLRADAACSDERARFKRSGFSFAPAQQGGRWQLVQLQDLPDGDTPVRKALIGLPDDTLWLHPEDELLGAAHWLSDRKSCLVRRGMEPVGYLHFSDLNSCAFQACVYHAVMHAEVPMLRAAEARVPDFEHWQGRLHEDVISRYRGMWRKQRKRDADRTPVSLLALADLVKVLAPELAQEGWPGEGVDPAPRLQSIADLRNATAHLGEPMVCSHDDVGRRADTLGTLMQLAEAALSLCKGATTL